MFPNFSLLSLQAFFPFVSTLSLSNALSGTDIGDHDSPPSLSSVIRSNAMLSLLFPVTKELKLSRNDILCLPLLLVPSILPVRDKISSPLWRHMCPKNFSCLFLIVFIRDLSWFVSSNIDSFVLFLAMIFLTFSCRTTFPLPLNFSWFLQLLSKFRIHIKV